MNHHLHLHPHVAELFFWLLSLFVILNLFLKFGDEDGPGGRGARQANPFQNADFSPEDLFQAFFGGMNGMGPGEAAFIW